MFIPDFKVLKDPRNSSKFPNALVFSGGGKKVQDVETIFSLKPKYFFRCRVKVKMW